MKKFFAIITLTTILFSVSPVVSEAQNMGTVGSQEFYYNFTRMRIHDGDDAYSRHDFQMAKTYYESARLNNDNCTHQYISDAEIQRKIDKCNWAMNHNNKTHEDLREEREDREHEAEADLIGSIVNLFRK